MGELHSHLDVWRFPTSPATQYTAQYNSSVQREIAKDLLLQINYVGRRAIVCSRHTISILATANLRGSAGAVGDTSNSNLTCGPTYEDTVFGAFNVAAGGHVHLPNGQIITGAAGGTPMYIAGTRPYCVPNCVTSGPKRSHLS